MKCNLLKNIIALLAVCFTLTACGNDLTPAIDKTERQEVTDGGYLFAFITNARYYKIHYAISRDCYNWQTLNKGDVINQGYKGHPDICRGGDGKYYMIGVMPLALWSSEDLINWDVAYLNNKIFDDADEIGFYAVNDYGAPKIFYDEDTGQYMISWHGCRVKNANDWQSMRTLFILTKDFKTYTKPQLLFNFTGDDESMSIIDTIIRKINGKYYAILKDERDREDAPLTGKTVRIATSDNLTGPYTNPGEPVTPLDLLREAPIYTQLPDGRHAILAESYNCSPFSYQMFTSLTMDGPWVENTFVGPMVGDGTTRPGARHGCIIRIPENIYNGLLNKYSDK